MKTVITFLIFTFIFSFSFGQGFEGKIVYSNSYKSKMPSLSDEQFTQMMGPIQEYFIKEGNYKSTGNGGFFQWQLYIIRENRIYNKLANSETIQWNDGTFNMDEVLKSEIKKGVAEVLGYKYDEIIFTCKSGTQKYYFNSDLSINPDLFAGHKFGNWFDFVSRSKALPLKSIIDNNQFTLESVATEVKQMKLENSFFELPPDSKTIKSSY